MIQRNSLSEDDNIYIYIYINAHYFDTLFGRWFTFLTDHKWLLSLFGWKNGIPMYFAWRLQCWTTIFLGYNFIVLDQKTIEFSQTDALSRLISSERNPEEDTLIPAINVDGNDCVRTHPFTAIDIKRETKTGPHILQVLWFIQGPWPRNLTGNLLQFKRRRDSVSIILRTKAMRSRCSLLAKFGHRDWKHSLHGSAEESTTIRWFPPAWAQTTLVSDTHQFRELYQWI